MKIDDENLEEQCPAPEGLGAYVDRKLTSEEESIIESHLVKCKHCREIIKSVIESESEAPALDPPDIRK